MSIFKKMSTLIYSWFGEVIYNPLGPFEDIIREEEKRLKWIEAEIEKLEENYRSFDHQDFQETQTILKKLYEFRTNIKGVILKVRICIRKIEEKTVFS